mmetsp:Transcript_11436/g.21146  ORF Transcript_11436/g.21146 Transcript_11436/m.21146 type:complete len:116 (+) Transcript_11436:218-565(+)
MQQRLLQERRAHLSKKMCRKVSNGELAKLDLLEKNPRTHLLSREESRVICDLPSICLMSMPCSNAKTYKFDWQGEEIGFSGERSWCGGQMRIRQARTTGNKHHALPGEHSHICNV